MVIGSGKEIFLTVSAIHTESSEPVREMEVLRRNCIFSDEKNVPNAEVTVFKTYSQENCFLECRAKALLKECGCLPYYYPRLDAIPKVVNGHTYAAEGGTEHVPRCHPGNALVLAREGPGSPR